MKIITRKMPDYKLDDSFEQIKGLDGYMECYAGNAMETFLHSLEMAGDDPHINLEDDIILCDNFLNKIMAVIEKHPDKLISFFTLKKSVKQTTVMSGRTFCMAQCFYMPKGWAKELTEFISTWDKMKEHPTGLDYAIADFMMKKKESYILYQPSLVQHRVGKSRIDPRRSTKRQSITFNKE